jgi:competence protein ComEC
VAPYWILAAFAAGIGLSAGVPALSGSWPPVLAGTLALLWLTLRRSPLAWVPLAAAIGLGGFVAAHQALAPPVHEQHVSRFISAEAIAVEGVVRQVEQLWNGSARLDIAVDRVGTGSAAALAFGLVRLSIREGGTTAVPGDRVCWRGRLRRPLLFGTPGEFDYPRHLAARDIYVSSAIGQGADLARLAGPSADGRSWERLRSTIAARIAKALPAEQAALVQTLTVGSGGGISPQQRQLLSEGGLAHLFSISGLHFGMLAMLLYGAANWLYCRSENLLLRCPPRRILPLLLLLPLFGYLLLSGNAAPTRRAYGMTLLAALLFSRNRRTPPLALLATVALGLLLISPLSLFEPSFQLSFAGVLGLMVWLPRWQGCLAGRPAWLRIIGMMLFTTLAASLSTAPFALWHFHQLAPAGLVTNLIAIPLVAWGAVPAGLLGALLLPLAAGAADLCFTVAGALSALALTVTQWLTQLPGLGAVSLFVTWREGLGVLLLLVAIMLPLRWRQAVIALAVGGSLLICLPMLGKPDLQVTALSVGQGDATLLTLGGEHYLIDGGGLTGSAIDIGERLVAPALGRLGIRRLAGIVLTHDHPDHSAGLPYILEQFQVGGFWSALPPEAIAPTLAEILRRRTIPVHTLPEGWTVLNRGGKAALSLFVPGQTAKDLNDRSIVVHTAVGGEGVLLPGDLAVEGFEQLCAAGLPEPVTLLKLPHHGSRGSRPERFLDRLQPRLAFVSAGRDNSYRLPHPASVAACAERGVPLFRTDHQGTLTFTTAGRSWQVQCFQGVRH